MAARHGIGSGVADFSTPPNLQPPTPKAKVPEPGRVDCTVVNREGKALGHVNAAWPTSIIVGDTIDLGEGFAVAEVIGRTWNRHGELTIALDA